MKVLLAIDGSPHSDAAVRRVRWRRWPYGTVVEVLTIIHSPAPLVLDPALGMSAVHVEQLEEQQRVAVMLLDAAAEQLGGEGLEVRTKILAGSATEVIVQEARTWGADLIVVGSHGHGRLRRLLLGSVADAVVAEAPCSVLVVRDPRAFDNSESAA